MSRTLFNSSTGVQLAYVKLLVNVYYRVLEGTQATNWGQEARVARGDSRVQLLRFFRA